MAVAAADDALLTWTDICARYPDEWVVLSDIERADHNFVFRSARVVAHAPRRAVALGAARGVIGTRATGSFFTGRKRGPISGAGWL